MSERMQADGIRVVSGGTDNHLFLVDLRSVDEDLTGKDAARMLDRVGITLNFNSIPNDPRPPFRASRRSIRRLPWAGRRPEAQLRSMTEVCARARGQHP